MNKKIISIILFLAFGTPLLPQLGNVSFVEFIEKMQYDDPEKSIRWFRVNGYTPEYGVNERVFDFYRGISRYLSYVAYQGARTELSKAASDFRISMELPQDNVYYYKDRSILYIAGILTILSGDKEVPARIFEYFVNTSSPSNPYYITALYWSAYLRYVTRQTYESYYNTLMQLSRDSRNTIYDYSTGRMKSVSEMIRRLEIPSKMTPNNFQWSKDNTDVYTLIKNVVPILPEDQGLQKSATQKFIPTPNYPPTQNIEPPAKPQTNMQTYTPPTSIQTNTRPPVQTNTQPKVDTNQTEIIDENIEDTVIIEEPPIIYIPPTKTNEKETPITSPTGIPNTLTIIVNKNPINGPLRVDIAGHLVNTVESTNFKTAVEPGTYQAIITFARNIYTNTIVVEPSKDNIFTIIVEDVKTKAQEYLISSSGISLNNNAVSLLEGPNANKTRNTMRNILTQPAYIATEWFNTNPYRKSMGISPEEYAYYRGVAYYARFVNEGGNSSSYAAQAKSDLTYAYEQKDNLDLLMRTELYLGALNLFAYNNLYDADKWFATVQSKLSEGERYYPTVLYWRVRIGVINSEQRANYIRILNSMSKNTPILDYTTTKFETISTMPSYKNKISGIIPIGPASPLLQPPRSTINRSSSSINSNNPNVRLFVNDISKDRYQINVLSRGINTILPYRGLIYSGINNIVVSSASKSIPFRIQANENESYYILFLILG